MTLRRGLCLLLMLGAACGGSDAPADEPTSTAEDNTTQPGTVAQEEPAATLSRAPSAIVKGVVRFEGTPPRRRKVDLGAEKYCREKRTDVLRDESVLVNDEGTLRNVFVWVKKGVKGKFPVPAEPVVINQLLCQYVPHVLGVQAGQKLLIRNSDPLMHNIHAVSKRGQDFNYAQIREGMESEEVFRRPEVMVELKCDVHGWMGAYVGVVKHPFFGVTGDGGTFELGKLPPGSYTIEAWHEVYGTQTKTVTLAEGQTAELRFTFADA